MIVDSSALPEQVVADVLASAFDSAGQRCSALRVLCLQDAIADAVLNMLKGAMAELKMGNPARLETDVGPVIDAGAQAALNAYVESKRSRILFQTPLAPSSTGGTFVAPTLLRIDSINELTHEVFGPILHVIRFKRDDLPNLIDSINGTGYGLTLGIHSRIDETIDFIVNRARVGNIYVNRNMIGAVVGVQPFGGEGLSGTGPKAGGPLYVHRLLRHGPTPRLEGVRHDNKLEHLALLAKWIEGGASSLLTEAEGAQLAEAFDRYRKDSPLPVEMTLKGPVGEDNQLRFLPRGTILGIANSVPEVLHQFGAALATGNRFLLQDNEVSRRVLDGLPMPLRARIASAAAWDTSSFDAVLVCEDARAREIAKTLARSPGPIVPVLAGPEYGLTMLVKERTVSINTAAAGGNASLMTIGK
jgi:RHH-type proline utilization regulon transcriptional repressor/proline dehydrogenase/delta 1-pyrroline-5-carboxylate dehydrogenase